MTVKSLTASGCALLLAAMALPARTQVPAEISAGGLQSLAAVQAAAERALRRQIGTQLGGVMLRAIAPDARLRLPACASALETYAQPPRGNQARALVRVSCSSGAVWTLNVPVEIRVVPTARDADGLAFSSRNSRLSDDERIRARALPRALETGDPAAARAVLAEAGIEPDYVEVADLDGPTLAVAATVGATRLIDNVRLEGDPS